MKNILIPLSLWDTTHVVLEQGGKMAQAFGGTVHVLHVLKSPGFSDPKKWPKELHVQKQREIAALRNEVEGRTVKLLDRGIDVRTLVLEGQEPADVILEQAGEIPADLIVMGAHGRGFLYGTLMGDVATTVIRRARCPVVIVPMRLTEA